MIEQTIETERFVLRPLRVSDAEEMVAVLADASLYEFEGGEPPTVDSLRMRYQHQVGGPDDPGETWWNWIIRTREDERAMGFVQADVVGASADLGWLVGVADQSRGVATESARAVIDWLVKNGVCRIEAHIHAAHTASQIVAGRIGLSNTGIADADGELVWAADASLS